MATMAGAAAHIDLSVQRFRTLLDEQVIERRPPRSYDIEEVRVSYIRHLRKRATGRAAEVKADGQIDLPTERALLAREQREGQSLKNTVMRGDLVDVDEVGRQVEREYAVVRERLLNIAGKLSGGLNARQLERLTSEIDEALDELHDPGGVAARLGQPHGEVDESEDGSEATAPPDAD